jgi:hypothetical protein
MDHETDEQNPSGTEGREVKAGNFVWVKCKVIEPCESLIKVTPSGDDNWFWAGRGQCRPVEPAKASEIPDSSSEPLAVGDPVVVVEPAHKWHGVRGRIVSVSESNEFPLEFISDCRERLGYFRSSSIERIDQADPINPSHYKQGGIECIEAIKAALGEGFPDYLRGNVMKYLWRYKEKGGADDLRKSAWYLDRLIKEVGE